MSLESWLFFTAMSSILLVTPGPVVVLAVNATLSRGRIVPRIALGAALGDLLAISVSASGLGLLLVARPDLIAPLKLAGSVCLLVMGLRAIHRARLARHEAAPTVQDRSLFSVAFVLTALHPSGLTFLVAYVPLFLDAGRPLVRQFVVMQVTFVAIGAATLTGWMWIAHRTHRMARTAERAVLLQMLAALVMLVFGAVSAALSLADITRTLEAARRPLPSALAAKRPLGSAPVNVARHSKGESRFCELTQRNCPPRDAVSLTIPTAHTTITLQYKRQSSSGDILHARSQLSGPS